MRLDDLQKSLSEMNEEELRLLLLSIRKDRRVSKAATRPAARREKVKKSDTLQTLIAGMTPEEREALLNMMGDD